jgi:hypothetical protein
LRTRVPRCATSHMAITYTMKLLSLDLQQIRIITCTSQAMFELCQHLN